MGDQEAEEFNPSQPIARADGSTDAERYLKTLCDRSFLSLWSYSRIFRDQFFSGKNGYEQRKGDGKELCDLLVVFENHIVIFSDKDCEFPDTGNVEVDWSRWFRKAVTRSTSQVWGAERWIRDYPGRLFLDPACTQRFPIALPDPSKSIFHRVVVAHGAAERCKKELGGSGSLMIVPAIVGSDQHTVPFAIGQIDPKKGYVHVFDDTTLDIILEVLDTVSDFVEYLNKKEELINTGKLMMATGEEEIFAFYMQHFDDSGAKGFVFPEDVNAVYLDKGMWDDFTRHPRRIEQLRANKISYSWDALIEIFSKHMFAGTQYHSTNLSLAEQEPVLRFLARENRTQRRMLANSLLELIEQTPSEMRMTRVVSPSRTGDPYYVFVLVPLRPGDSYDKYREVRLDVLNAYCMVTKLRYPEAEHIIGIATETAGSDGRSEDVLYLDGRAWTEEDEAEARRLQVELGLLNKATRFERTEYEYPDPCPPFSSDSSAVTGSTRKGRDRNKPCPCGSGRKFKKCCGRSGQHWQVE